MKTKKIQKKLLLQKETVSNLCAVDMSRVYGQLNQNFSKIFNNCDEYQNVLALAPINNENPDDVRPSKGCVEK